MKYMKYIALVSLFFLSACQQEVKIFGKENFPKQLSEWGVVLVDGQSLILNKGVVAYDLNTPLFTDYAHKLRTIWVPRDKIGQYTQASDIELPIGSIVTKTFFYPRRGKQLLLSSDESDYFMGNGLDLSQVRLIETRVMVHLEAGWEALPYVWDDAQNEATLAIAGDALSLSLTSENSTHDFQYIVPDYNQCQGCHIENLNTKEMGLIGVKARHLDKAYTHLHKTSDQLGNFVDQKILQKKPEQFSRNANWKQVSSDSKSKSKSKSKTHIARSYLDINCGHCHNPNGAADTSGMFLNIGETEGLQLGVCKPPVAAGQGTGGRPVGILPGNSEASILTFRMQSVDVAAMMPELGRSLVHVEGVQAVSDWIDAMEGNCT
jgi:uncharacterized repeat protein (TIGR03806 family)